MKELIEKLESAEHGSRELDAEVALATGYVSEREGNCFYGNPDHSVLVLERDYYDNGGHAPELPRFTSSIDGALSLVPQTKYMRLERYSDGWYAFVSSRSDSVSGWRGEQKPAALALCIAALRARSTP